MKKLYISLLFTIYTLDGVALLITDHFPPNSTIMHSRGVCKDVNLCPEHTISLDSQNCIKFWTVKIYIKLSKVRPYLSFEGTLKIETVLKQTYIRIQIVGIQKLNKYFLFWFIKLLYIVSLTN